MDDYQPGSLPEVFQLIENLHKRLNKMQASTLRAAGLTPPQYYVLSLLWEQDGRTFKDLADRLNTSRATVTEIMDTLVRKGAIVRAPNPEDRRSLLARLTPAGEALRDATPALREQFGRCCHGLDGDETRQLSDLLKKLERALNQ